ncbi:flavin reductase [Acinetobacter boissieri]|uniref:Flavin reductase n=1 Tax=Acinetobacter boissieri TaxID=1219383 RepID=A0A1G6JSU0_9GAMM|nr:flavin reductase [Acinetobacter boissieri]SDC21066.1 flavin reductase [Acinetobacter boissieri]
MSKQITQDDFRTAVARLSAAVNVVTTDGIGGLAGFTASAVCSLTDAPAMLLVCLQKKSSAYQSVKSNGVVCINTLGATNMEICKKFSGRHPMLSRFENVEWSVSSTGSPVLNEAIVSFDCTVVEFKSVETHDILLCKVEDILYGKVTQAALVYYNREFCEV